MLVLLVAAFVQRTLNEVPLPLSLQRKLNVRW